MQFAKSIQDQLHAWIANQVGPHVDPALLTPQVTAQDDHYALRLPIPGLVGDGTASARLLPLEHDRWSLQAIQLPSVMRFNLRLSEPGAPSTTVSTAASITIGGQDSHALIDPSLHTGSDLHIELHDLTMRSQGPQAKAQQHMGEYQLDASLQPNPAGGLDLRQAAVVSGWSSSSQVPGKPAMRLSADRIAAKGQIDGLNRDQAGAAAFRGVRPDRHAARRRNWAERRAPPGSNLCATRRAAPAGGKPARHFHQHPCRQEDIDGLHVAAGGALAKAVSGSAFRLRRQRAGRACCMAGWRSPSTGLQHPHVCRPKLPA